MEVIRIIYTRIILNNLTEIKLKLKDLSFNTDEDN